MAWNPFPFGSIEYDNWNYEHPNDVRDEVVAAKQTLGRADDLSKSIEPMAGEQDDANGFLNEKGSVFDSSIDKLARLGRQIVRPIPDAARGAAGVGSLLPGPVGDVSRLATGAMSGANLAMGGTERLKEHPVLSAMDVAGVLTGGGALRGLRGLKAGADVAGLDMAANLGGRALAHEGPSIARRAVDPMQRLAAASSPIEQLMETPSFRNLPKGNVSKAKAKPAFQDAPKTPSVFERMKAEGAFQGDRTTGQFEEGAGGLSSIAGRAPRPNASPSSIMHDMEESYGHGLRPTRETPWEEIAVPSATPLSAEQRLAARSMERFGKKYRKE